MSAKNTTPRIVRVAGARSSPEVRAALESEGLPHARYGIPAGIVGASVVAVFFLVVDWIGGRPFATPSALGATMFLGEPFDLSGPPNGVIVTGYTLMHGTVFVAMASLLTIALFSSREPRRPSLLLWGALSAVAFALSEGFFACFTLLAGSAVWSELGFLRVTVANALAAVSMGILLTWYVAHAQREVSVHTPSLDARRHRNEPDAIHENQIQSPLAGRDESRVDLPNEKRS